MMTIDELQTKRIHLWHARSEDALEETGDMIAFLRDLQWCYIVPKKTRAYPSLFQAVAGTAEYRITPSRLASLRLLLDELWAYPPMTRSMVEIHILGHGPMLVTRNFCRNLGIFFFEGKTSPRRMVRERHISSLEAEILGAVRRDALAKRSLREALNIRTRNGAADLEVGVRSLERHLMLVRVGPDDIGKPRYRSAVALLGIRSSHFSENQRRKAADALIRGYLDAVVADSRSGIKSFFRGIIPHALIDAVLYDLLLRSVLKVDSSLILNGKKAILNRKP